MNEYLYELMDAEEWEFYCKKKRSRKVNKEYEQCNCDLYGEESERIIEEW